jgi:hypothetical protein
LWNNASGYHRSKITIHDAIAAGLPLDAAELKEGLNEPFPKSALKRAKPLALLIPWELEFAQTRKIAAQVAV